MDHYQTRFPTNVLDIASFLVRLASMNSSLFSLTSQGLLGHTTFFTFSSIREPERPKSARLPPIIHYSTEELFTKYEICLVFARILGLPHAHIIPDAGPPPPGTGAISVVSFLLTNTDDLIRVYLLRLASRFLFLETGSTPRPRNTQLYLRETEDLGVEGGLGTGGFEEWWTDYLRNN
jgi:S-adenosylmethionine synthetase